MNTGRADTKAERLHSEALTHQDRKRGTWDSGQRPAPARASLHRAAVKGSTEKKGGKKVDPTSGLRKPRSTARPTARAEPKQGCRRQAVAAQARHSRHSRTSTQVRADSSQMILCRQQGVNGTCRKNGCGVVSAQYH